jgi:hypothetical protein
MQCVYELDISLVGHTNTEYVFDMYTAVAEHTWTNWATGHPKKETSCAVGICTGLAAVDYDAEEKGKREVHFPFQLLKDGTSFECSAGEASFPSDKDRILLAIGGSKEQQLLDATVHGRVAAAALGRALQAGGEDANRFLQAIAAGRLQRLELDLNRNDGDTVVNMTQLVRALDCETLQELTITRASKSWSSAGDWLREAIGNRNFDKLTKMDLQGESSPINAEFIIPCFLQCAYVC